MKYEKTIIVETSEINITVIAYLNKTQVYSATYSKARLDKMNISAGIIFNLFEQMNPELLHIGE